jgi:hypothetical protein
MAECRGLVLRDGEVLSRPVQRFLRVAELGGLVHELVAQTVTEKLDGQMVCGVVIGDAVELWSRGGQTAVGKAATRIAREKDGMLELINEVWTQGGSPTFEFIGKQSLVKIRYGETELVLVAIRDRESGEWWGYEMLERLCARHAVRLVARYRELEGRCVREIREQVSCWKGKEGVVVTLGNSLVCKVKSNWWMNRGAKQCRRWGCAGEGKEVVEWRRQKKTDNMECRQQRVVLRGWSCKVSPVLALAHFGADKVEAMYRRTDGRQGTVVLGFRDKSAAKAVRGRHVAKGMAVWAEQAYSGRCRSGKERLVRTWWKQSGGQGTESESGSEGGDESENENANESEKGNESESEGERGNESESECRVGVCVGMDGRLGVYMSRNGVEVLSVN